MPRTPEDLRAQAQRNAKLAEHRDQLQELLRQIDVLLLYWGQPEECLDEKTANLRRELGPAMTPDGVRLLRAKVMERLAEIEAAQW
jgi:hypothetical protein